MADDTIYVANSDGVLYALSTEDGAEVWTAELESSDAAGTPAVANGVVYAAGDGEDFYALDAEAGDEVWTVDLDGAVDGPPGDLGRRHLRRQRGDDQRARGRVGCRGQDLDVGQCVGVGALLPWKVPTPKGW